ncbi:MAG TPA: nucleotide disphospho-sugar-binding domain-containing protein [Gammaproteobacteria bacterium]
MARVLLAWELGAGLGHLVPLAAMGRELTQAGHECAYVLRDLGHAHTLLDVRHTRLYQAPLLLPAWRNGDIAWTFADILANIGYRNPAPLTGLLAAWRGIYADFKPDLIVFDHAPTAQAAARGLNIPTALLARSGFTIPPAITPLPRVRPSDGNSNGGSRAQDLERETAVTRVLNTALESLDIPPLEFVGQLFDADARVLLSLPELDPYGPRDDVEYWGPLEHDAGVAPEWPAANRPKIFAYLRAFQTRPALLDTLRASGASVVAHFSDMDAAACAQQSSNTMKVSRQIIDIRRALAECDLVITHGGSLVGAALIAGKPLLMLPLHLEQQLTASAVETLGAGLSAPRLMPEGMRNKLERLLREPSFGAAARAFAARYPQYPASLEGRFAALAKRQIKQ